MTQPDPDGSGSLTAPVTSYQYDSAQNLTQITLPGGATQSWVYSSTLNQPTSATNELSKTTSFTYDSYGNLLTATSPLGYVTTYTYNSDGQVLTVTAPDPDGSGSLTSPLTSFSYDSVGRLTTIGNINPTISQVANSGPANEGSNVTVTVTATAPAGLSYEFDFDNDFVYEVGPQASSVASHLFADNGIYRVNVRVTTSAGGAAVSFTDVVVNNAAPSVAANSASVTINEGSTVTNAGVWSDPGLDAVTLTASIGSVTKDADGTWNWSFSSTDGPDQSQTVTITATDSDGAATATTFSLVARTPTSAQSA